MSLGNPKKLSELNLEGKENEFTPNDLESFFNVYEDYLGQLSFNLNSTVYFTSDPKTLLEYTCSHDMFWPLVSYKLYKTTRLAWLLMKLNNVTAETVTNKLKAGDKVFYIPFENVNSILDQLVRAV